MKYRQFAGETTRAFSSQRNYCEILMPQGVALTARDVTLLARRAVLPWTCN